MPVQWIAVPVPAQGALQGLWPSRSASGDKHLRLIGLCRWKSMAKILAHVRLKLATA